MLSEFVHGPQITRARFDRVVNRDLHVVGVPRHHLPPEGFTVHYDASPNPAENPLIQSHGAELAITGPDIRETVVHRSSGSGLRFMCCNAVTIENDYSHHITISRPRRLPAILVQVPDDLTLTTAQRCRNVNLSNLAGVSLGASSAGGASGRNLGHVELTASGASSVRLHQIQSLNAYLSGASDVVAHGIARGAHVTAHGASDATLTSAQGPLTGEAAGASSIRAQGAFTAVQTRASGASDIDIDNTLAVYPHVTAGGASSIRLNGRRIAG